MEMGNKKPEEAALTSSSPTAKKDTEAAQPTPRFTKSKHRRRNICLAATGGTIITIVLIIVILAFTVFKAKKPQTNIDNISFDNFKMSLDIARMGVDLNMTLDVDLTVKNPNKVGMNYKNGTALIKYRGGDVGEVPIPAGKIGSDDTKPMNVTVTIMADRMLSNSQLFNDLRSGYLNLTTLIKLSGKVKILKIFKISVDTTTTCDISAAVSVNGARIAEQKCKYKAKI